MRFIDGPPTFAVEVRSEHDYGAKAETELAAKRADYFQAGTRVVWDVDPLAKTIAVYRADEDPDKGTPYVAMQLLRGETLQARLWRGTPGAVGAVGAAGAAGAATGVVTGPAAAAARSVSMSVASIAPSTGRLCAPSNASTALNVRSPNSPSLVTS